MQKIATCLWFDGQAEEAVALYSSLFEDSRTVSVLRNSEASPGATGSVLVIDFEIAGRRFQALNGGPEFTFNEAMSLSVDCADQAEVDRLWDALTADGGQEVACGWLKDRFGVSWQIVPSKLPELLTDPDPAKADRVMKAMMGMTKIDVQGLLDAYGE